jgi:hypothetical protein
MGSMIPGAPAVIAGAARGGTGDKFGCASLVKEDHTKGRSLKTEQ